MNIRTIPLSQLEANPTETLNDCVDSGEAFVVELSNGRFVAIQSLEPTEDDSLIDTLLETNGRFRELVGRSKASPLSPFGVEH